MNNKLLDTKIYRLCGHDVVCVLENMGLRHIAEDEEMLKEVIEYLDRKLEIPWTEYVQEHIECGIEHGDLNFNEKEVIAPTFSPALQVELQNAWRSVKDKLPKKDSHVLVSFDDGFVCAVEYVDDWELWVDSGEVVAWMPLPDPYKK